MKVLGFPDNCGSAIVSQFYLPHGGYASSPPLATLNKELAQLKSQNSILSGLDGRKRTVLFAITVARQLKAIKAIQKHKGIIIYEFVNQNTGAKNTLWAIPL